MLVIVFLYVIVTGISFSIHIFTFYAWKCFPFLWDRRKWTVVSWRFLCSCCYSIVLVCPCPWLRNLTSIMTVTSTWTLLLYRASINELERYRIFIDSSIVRPQILYSILVHSTFTASDEWHTAWGLFWHGPRTWYVRPISRCVSCTTPPCSARNRSIENSQTTNEYVFKTKKKRTSRCFVAYFKLAFSTQLA